MNKIRQKTNLVLFYFFILLILCTILTHSIAFAQDEFISIDEIYPGMEGIGKTVFSGTEVENFNVQVIDVILGTEVNLPYILVKLSGGKIDKNGGISAGMSGSPVYLEGKLAGAISHAWEMSDHNLCLITPIEKMITLFDQTLKVPSKSISDIADREIVSINLDDELEKKLIKSIPDFANTYKISFLKKSSIKFEYLQTPLLISGFDGRAKDLLEKKFQNQELIFIQNISNYQNIHEELEIGTGNKELKPGSAVGVQLSVGDASILTIGTATYFKDNFALAFGHPFMHQGNVSYLFSAVYIYHSFPSMVMPFKIGAPYRLLGEVIQDREVGILAQLNQFPKIVVCKIITTDLDREIEISSGTKMVPDKNVLQSVVPAFLVQSIDHAIDRIGQGTAIVRLNVKSANSRKNIKQENMFFSKNDIAIKCGEDLEEIFDLINNNYSENIELSEIGIDITIREQNQSAIIKEVILDKEEYFPGDTVEVRLTVKPFRQPEETKIAKIALPGEMETGEAILMVRGGASSETIDNKSFQDKKKYLLNGWDDIQKYVNEKTRNNQINAELILINKQEKLMSTNTLDEQVDDNELTTTLDTSFIVEGYHEVYVNIKKKENKDKDQIDE
ncbi:MAG: SpoIVB peptidase S55 domain-containing protein [Atribacterota bacterium]